MEFSQFLANQHQRLVPFPIVLFFAALALDVAGLIFRSERAHWAARLGWLFGTATLMVAFVCGICAEIWAGRAGVPQDAIELHELAATVVAWSFILLTAWRVFLDAHCRRALKAFVICGTALYALMVITGYLGGKLVTEYGAAVTGADAKTMVSLHDLNTLAQRQTDLNLDYSDLMHHAAGWFVVALTLTIFVRELWPQHASKVSWVGPSLLMVGGLLLFFTADLDLYKLTDPRQFLDREAQAHKLISVILFSVGLYLLLKKRPAATAEPTAAQIQLQNRVVAIVALVGGGLLFTHVHTVAPYANVAAGVYVNHVTMGLVALAIGAVKLLDDARPGRTRGRALWFPILLAAESFLLVTYTEGLPWFIGYGHYNRWGIHGGSIAPFGRERAEFVYNPQTAQMDVNVYDRFADTPVRVAATNINVVVARGYERSTVPLQAVDAVNGLASRFFGSAPFLKDAAFLDVSVTLPIRGERRTGHFDPWVTAAVVGVPPNEVANFACPMHEGMRSKTSGVCPLCGMPLVPIDRRPRLTLHDEKFAMQFQRTADTIRLVPQFSATGETCRDLVVTHEHLLHLIVTSDDLQFFDHVHPVRQADGSFTIDYHFPRAGKFILFADITPRGERSQVFRFPVDNGGVADAPAVLEPLPAPAREIGRYHVELIAQPPELTAEREAQLAFRLVRDGRPVTDLQPYIGAMGHCVIVSEDTQTYLHSHPEQLGAPPTAETRGGPIISFHTHFPRPGRYKVWGQFKCQDEIIVADFVVEVAPPILPRWFVSALLRD